jgi:hypothetical protein
MEQTESPDKCSLYTDYPLDLESDQIRLLELYRGRWDDPVCCKLRIVSLADTSDHTTLLYVWGSPE